MEDRNKNKMAIPKKAQCIFTEKSKNGMAEVKIYWISLDQESALPYMLETFIKSTKTGNLEHESYHLGEGSLKQAKEEAKTWARICSIINLK